MFRTTKVCASLMVAFGGGLLMAAAPVLAQSTPQTLERVEITGSSIKRIEGESSAPIQVMKRQDIERTGATSVEQLMRSVSAMVSSNSTAAASSSGATTGGISTVSLRGLTAERTLILINGKRLAPYGAPDTSVAVDVDSIPVSAIERVEILKDGASAIYGSDAIAGVVNFILRKDFKGVELSASYGAATQDGKGDVTKFSAVTGFGDIDADRFNVMLMGSYQKDGALFGRDREFARTSVRLDENNFGGSSRSDPANISIPGFGVFNPRVNGAAGQGDCSPNGVYVPEAGPNICLFDTGPYVGLIPATERWSLVTSGRLNISDALQIYGDLGWTRKESKTVIQPSPIDAAFGIPFMMTTANPFYPTAFVQSITGGATPTLSVRYRPFIIGNRALTDTADAVRGLVGIQGNLAGWDYDASFLHATSQVTEKLDGGYFRINNDSTGPGIVPLLSGQVLGSNGQPLWLNPFGDNSAEVAAAAKATNFIGEAFKTNTKLTSLQAKASREIMQLRGGGLGMALGGEVRNEGFKLNSAAALGTGNISGYGGNFVSLDTDRKMAGLFAEISAPVLKGLELGAAVRYDRYDATKNPLDSSVAGNSLAGFISVPSGDTMPQSVIDRIAAESTGDAPSFAKSTGKLSLRYQAMQELLVRGTVSTGFRAPSLLDLYGPVQAGVSEVQNDPRNCQGANAGNPDFCFTQFNVYNGGNSRLKPEESKSVTLGIVLEPVRGWSVGVDYFNTKVKNMIQVLSSTFILENEAIYQDRVTRGPSGEIIAIDQRLENTGKVALRGVDFDLRGSLNTDVGRVGLNWVATYMDKWKSQNPDGTWSNDLGETSGSVAGYIPRLRHSTTLTWESGAWGVAATYNWQSGATDQCGNLLQDDFGNCAPQDLRRAGSYETIDAQVKWTGIKNVALTLGARNLLDRDPPYVNASGGAFQSGYDPTYVDPRGRFVYLTATYKF